jgi:hypothetical protein
MRCVSCGVVVKKGNDSCPECGTVISSPGVPGIVKGNSTPVPTVESTNKFAIVALVMSFLGIFHCIFALMSLSLSICVVYKIKKTNSAGKKILAAVSLVAAVMSVAFQISLIVQYGFSWWYYHLWPYVSV